MVTDSRKIAAILAADVVGYSRLMGVDEQGALAALKVRRAIFDRLVREFDGQEFGSVGDSLMAQFPSAINAVRCALNLQHSISQENDPLPADRRMAFRVGVNLGHVIEEKGVLFGDGVNIAARLQSLATPGGVLVSGAVYEQVRNKLSASFTFIGKRQVKNISEPVACYEATESGVASLAHRVAVRWDRRLWLWLAAAVAGVAAIVAVATWQWWGAADSDTKTRSAAAVSLPSSRVTAQAPAKSIAVLPFVNMSGDAENEYFADGLSEELLNLLAKIPELRVAARSSAFSFKGEKIHVQDVARKLNVAHLLEGSVRRSGNKVRITAQLIKTADGYHIWSQTYDRTLDDIFAVQDDIAGEVVKALQVSLLKTGLATRSKTQDPEAYDLVLKARHFRSQDNLQERFERSINYLRQSVQRDPSYAVAWANLSQVYAMQGENGFVPVAVGYRRARDAAERALSLDRRLVDAHLAMGNIHSLYDWDWAAADASFSTALELEPGNAITLQAATLPAVIFGRWDEAMELAIKAIARDPLAPSAHSILGIIFEAVSRDKEAEFSFRKALELNPDSSTQHLLLGRNLLLQGEAQAALREVKKIKAEIWELTLLPLVFDALGRRSESDAAFASLKNKYGGEMAYQIAEVHAFRGEADFAFEWLERAYDQRDPGVVNIKSDRMFYKLVNDPRYKTFLKKLKLP